MSRGVERPHDRPDGRQGTVAVGVDGSAESFAAVEWAGAEADARDAPLWLVCARKSRTGWGSSARSGDDDGAGGGSGGGSGSEEGPGTAAGSGREEPWPQVQLQAAHRLAAGLYPSLKITEDSVCEAPAKALLTAARDADVLVLGSRGLGPVEGFVLGSVGLSVIAHAQRPVVAVRGRMPGGAAAERGPVVAGIDMGQGTDAVLEFAFRTAAAQGRDVRVVNAWSVRPLYSYPSALPEPRMTEREGIRAESALEESVAPWRERFGDVRTELHAVCDAVAPCLLQVSADASLLAVGRRLRGHPFPTRIGPVVHALLHHSPRPVAVIPHG